MKNPLNPKRVHRTLHTFSESGIPPLLGTIILPESEGVEDEDLRWFTLDVDLESLSPHRSTEAGAASAAGADAAQPSSGSSQQPPTGGISQGGRSKRPAVQLSLTEEDPTRHRDNPAGLQLVTGRAKRQHRQHATNFRHRLFTQDHAKAALVACTRDSAPPSAAAVFQCECSCACCVQSDWYTSLWGLSMPRSTFAHAFPKESLSLSCHITQAGLSEPV